MREEGIKKAVALKYLEGSQAPFVTAKGRGLLANVILEEAYKNNIKIEENKTLVEFLSDIDINSYVPPETWEILAKIFSVILQEEMPLAGGDSK
jgi:flagellar biosynthesis protein